VTDQQRQSRIAALIREREGYLQRGLTDRAAEVDAALAALGASGRTPAKRATKRSN
jgi:hypothetical protein